MAAVITNYRLIGPFQFTVSKYIIALLVLSADDLGLTVHLSIIVDSISELFLSETYQPD